MGIIYDNIEPVDSEELFQHAPFLLMAMAVAVKCSQQKEEHGQHNRTTKQGAGLSGEGQAIAENQIHQRSGGRIASLWR
jgi:hypothetical protein